MLKCSNFLKILTKKMTLLKALQRANLNALNRARNIIIRQACQYQRRCISNYGMISKPNVIQCNYKTSLLNKALLSQPYILKYKFTTNAAVNDDDSYKLDAEGKPYEEQFYIDKSNPKYEPYTFPKRRWTDEELDVKITHIPPETTADKAAYYTVRFFRLAWDLFSGYTFGHRYGWFKWGENMWLRRVIFLESIAGM